jgi:hypothetical protein
VAEQNLSDSPFGLLRALRALSNKIAAELLVTREALPTRMQRYNPRGDHMPTGALEKAFSQSLKDPAGFWGEAAESVYCTRGGRTCSTIAKSRFTDGSSAAR